MITMEELLEQQKLQRELWKLSQIRKIIREYKNGVYGDDDVIGATAALNNIIEMAKEDE